MKKDISVKVLISCHKPARTLHSESFLPIQVGAALRKKHFAGMLYDDQGENISDRNPEYCELCSQYWAWKNLKADYYGFFHYRRYLNLSDKSYREDRYYNIYEPYYYDGLGKKYGLNDKQLRRIVKEHDIVTVKPHILDCSIMEHYGKGTYLHGRDLQLTVEIIKELTPDYTEAAEHYLQGNVAYFCNMYIMRKDIFYDYCQWLFPILERFCQQADMSNYSKEELRTPGHIAERLWGVYYTKNKDKYQTKELQSIIISDTNKSYGIMTAPFRFIKKLAYYILDLVHK